MAPCRGCRDKLNEITGNFPMKFVGRPEGKLLKGAPGNYVHGETYVVPYHYSEFAYWELIGEKPTLTVPEEDPEEFEEAFFLPEEEEVTETGSVPEAPVIEETVSAPVEPEAASAVPGLVSELDYEKNIRKINQGNYTVDKDGLINYDEPELSRKQLKKILDEAGVEYNSRTRTGNLRKLVDELDQKED